MMWYLGGRRRGRLQAGRPPVSRAYRTFHFERASYEAQIAGLPSAPIHDWTAELPINKQWCAARAGEVKTVRRQPARDSHENPARQAR